MENVNSELWLFLEENSSNELALECKFTLKDVKVKTS